MADRLPSRAARVERPEGYLHRVLVGTNALKVLEFYTQNAGDNGSSDSWFMRGVKASATPERITKMPFWRLIHGGFSPASFKRPQVRKAGNCLGCHG